MESTLIIAPFTDRLPKSYNNSKILSHISSDGQIYAVDTTTNREIRIETYNVSSLVAQASLDGWKEPIHEMGDKGVSEKKGKKKRIKKENVAIDVGERTFKFVRHLINERWTCRDCGSDTSQTHFCWTDRRCPYCWSTNIEASDMIMDPPFPAVIENYGSPPDLARVRSFVDPRGIDTDGHIWRESPDQDNYVVNVLMKSYRFAEYDEIGEPVFDNHRHLYLLTLFLETLTQFVAVDETNNLILMNISMLKGNVAQDLFRVCGDPQAASSMLHHFLEAAAIANDDPVNASLAKHSYGMAAWLVLYKYSERVAEQITHRQDLRETAVKNVREALEIAEGYQCSKKRGGVAIQIRRIKYALTYLFRSGSTAKSQIHRIKYVLADLLRICNASDTERAEAITILEELMSKGFRNFYAQVALLETLMDIPLSDASDESTVVRVNDAVLDLMKIVRGDDPEKFVHRVRWAVRIGRFFYRHGHFDASSEWLQSAVTFALKDVMLQIDQMRSTHDSEVNFHAFNTLATLYVGYGWWEEALALLETYRGRTIILASLSEREKVRVGIDSAKARNDKFFGAIGPHSFTRTILMEENIWETWNDRVLGPFEGGCDYELDGLLKRLWELYDQLGEEETVFISLAVEDELVEGKHILSAVIFALPKDPPRYGHSVQWVIEDNVYDELVSNKNLRPSSFREKRLTKVAGLIGKHIIEPMASELDSLQSSRAIVVAPGVLGNIPYEAFHMDEGLDERSLLPTRFAFMPSLMFGRGRMAVMPDEESRILILGYEGSDLRHAEDEARELVSLFGNKATYLPGSVCTKRRVIEELNNGYAFVHCVCHGTYDKENPRNSALYFTNDREMDAFRLTAAELREFVRLEDLPMITLSACSTALVADSRSNTWHGLPGSFLEIGARCVIGARWPVADHLARRVMSTLYQKIFLKQGTPLQCFHATQEEMRSSNIIEEWACFGYLGLP